MKYDTKNSLAYFCILVVIGILIFVWIAPAEKAPELPVYTFDVREPMRTGDSFVDSFLAAFNDGREITTTTDEGVIYVGRVYAMKDSFLVLEAARTITLDQYRTGLY
jgi:hypothetical protein